MDKGDKLLGKRNITSKTYLQKLVKWNNLKVTKKKLAIVD